MSKTTTSYNSTKNQSIKDKFVGIHSKACQTMEVNLLLKMGYEMPDDAPTWDEVKNYYTYEFGGENYSYDEIQKIIEDKKEKLEGLGYEFSEEENEEKEDVLQLKIDQLEDEINDLENLDSEPQEIYQWFLVSSYFGAKLKEKGEPILEFGNSIWWGRTCFGQSMVLDHVVSEICEDMNILEGQKNEW